MSEFRIVFPALADGVRVFVPSPGVSVEEAATVVPDGVAYSVIDAEDLPPDRIFRSAWEFDPDNHCVRENPVKCKDVAHEIRRAKRAAEFAPHDDVIANRLPGEQQAEAARQEIRKKYAELQEQIDACECVDDLLAALVGGWPQSDEWTISQCLGHLVKDTEHPDHALFVALAGRINRVSPKGQHIPLPEPADA